MFSKRTTETTDPKPEPKVGPPITTTHDTVVWKKDGQEHSVRVDQAQPVLRAVADVLKAYDPWNYRYFSNQEALARQPKSVTVQYQDGHRVTYTLGTTKSHYHKIVEQ